VSRNPNAEIAIPDPGSGRQGVELRVTNGDQGDTRIASLFPIDGQGAGGSAPCADGFVAEGTSTTRARNADRGPLKTRQRTSAIGAAEFTIRAPPAGRDVHDAESTTRIASNEASPKARSP
jgi:hypothetical protein